MIHLRFAGRRPGFGLTGQSSFVRFEEAGKKKDFGSLRLVCHKLKRLVEMGLRLRETC